jgi:hypothetical protein
MDDIQLQRSLAKLQVIERNVHNLAIVATPAFQSNFGPIQEGDKWRVPNPPGRTTSSQQKKRFESYREMGLSGRAFMQRWRK